jgi:hypothetical protein
MATTPLTAAQKAYLRDIFNLSPGTTGRITVEDETVTVQV